MKPNKLISVLIALGSVGLGLTPVSALAQGNLVETTQKNTEIQVRHLVDPLLDKYCPEQCKLLSVTTTVDVATPDTVAPGFDEVEVSKTIDLAPTSVRVKILIDDKVGPVSRSKLMELVGQFLETLDYPVKIDTQIAHFPAPIGTESRVAALREKVIKQFRTTMEELFSQFCPEQCLMADFNVSTEVVNAEEAQYGQPGEFIQEGDVSLRVRDITSTVLMDNLMSPEERKNILEMAKLKTNIFKNVTLTSKAMKFPHPTHMNGTGPGTNGLAFNGNGLNTPGNLDAKNKFSENSSKSESTQNRQTASTSDSKENRALNSKEINQNDTKNSTQTNETNQKNERYERFEKIERVESGDAVQAELKKFGLYGLIFGCAVISLLIFVAMASLRPRKSSGGNEPSTIQRVIQSIASDPAGSGPGVPHASGSATADDHRAIVGLRFEIERLLEELTAVFAQHPKVAKQVFSRVLTEEGVETTAQYIQLFGESIVVDMLRDPSLQSDLSELMEFYAKNPQEIKDDDKLELLRKLHNRTVAGKLVVMGNRSSNLFDFLAEMDGMQILELVRNESLTVKSIVLTQVDPQKRTAIYSQLDEDTRMRLLTELSRIDYLPRDYIFNVANALKRKRRDNPRLNTEALPGSEVLVNLLERTGIVIQRNVVKNLEMSNPESARTVKSKLVSPDTLRFLRDGQLLEVVLSLRHDELLQFLKGAPAEIKAAVFAKSPKELIVELEEELESLGVISREIYQGVERKVLNRMKMMANEGLINLVETNERMFMEGAGGEMISGLMGSGGGEAENTNATSSHVAQVAEIKKVAGW